MGEVLRGRYELLEVAGEGAEGTVLRSLDRQHGRVVALKVRSARAERREDLLAEARVLLAVPPHPHLPLVREDFFDGDRYVIAMDWVQGTDLGALLRTEGRPGLPVPSVLRWLADAAGALTHLHTQSPPVVHGDVKPANLILNSDGHLILVDFGLSSSPSTRGRRGGTLGYIAPELSAGAEPSRTSDVYALAATAWALLTGTPPTGIRPDWEGVAPSDAAQLEEAIRAGLATDPARRPSTPGELVEGIRAGWRSDLPAGVLTFCLTDIEGSTSRWEADPDAMARALVRHDDVVAAAVQAHGGKLAKAGEGDATVSVFTSATAAVEASASIQGALAMEEWPGGTPLRVRIGLHTGEAEHRGDDYFGVALSLASRVRALASGGEVFLSGATAALVSRSLPRGWELVDLGPHRLAGIEAPVHVRALAAPGVAAPPAVTESPYRGLLPFRPEDRDRFFGREATIARLAEILRERGFVAVVGSSGSGKSSVLRAGAAPLFPDARVVTPATSEADDLGGDELLIVDQFEELFTGVPEADRAGLIDAVLGRPGPVAIAVRADFYGHCGSHPGLAEAVASSQVLLGSMAEADLRRAISAPAAAAGLTLAPGLVDRVVDDVAGEPGALPLLSHALLATWERRDGRTLTLEGYRASGGVRGGIATSADRLMSGFDADDRALTRSILLRLIEPGDGTADTRRRARVGELQPQGDDPERFARVLAHLAEARLVTMDLATVEISHEALIREWPQLQAWLDEDREGLRTLTRLRVAAHEWERSGRDEGDLLRGARLAATLEWASATPMPIGAIEAEFLEACRRREDADLAAANARAVQQRRANRRLRSLLGITAVFLLTAIVAGVLAARQAERADGEAVAAVQASERADAERLGALSGLEEDLDLSLLLAAQAYTMDDTASTRESLLRAVQRSPAAAAVMRGEGGRLLDLELSPDGKLLAVNDNKGRTTVHDLVDGRPPGHYAGDAVGGLAWTPDGTALVRLDVSDGHDPSDRERSFDAVVLDATTLEERARYTGRTQPTSDLTFSPDAQWLVASPTTDGPGQLPQVTIWDATRPGPPARTVDLPEGVQRDEDDVSFDASGDRLAVSGADATLLIDVRSGELTQSVVGRGGLFSPDGRTLAVNAGRGDPLRLDLVDVETGERRALDGAHTERILHRTFNRDGTMLATSGDDRLVRLWDTATGRELRTLAGHTGRVLASAFSPDGTLLYSTGLDQSVITWDLTGRTAIERLLIDGEPGSSNDLFTLTGDRSAAVVVPPLSDVLEVTELGSAPREHSIDTDQGLIFELVGGAGSTLYTGGPDGVIRRWDALTGERLAERSIEGTGIHPLVLAPDQSVLYAQTETGMIRALDPVTLDAIDAEEHDIGRYVRAAAASPDGRALAISTLDPPTVAVIDLETRSHQSLDVSSTVESLAFSPDGAMLIAGDYDGQVLRMDAVTGALLGDPVLEHDGPVTGVSFSPDGSRFTSDSTDGTIRVWDSASGRDAGRIQPGAPNTPARATWAPDGKTLLAMYEDGSVHSFDPRPATWLAHACRTASRQLTPTEWSLLLPDRPFDPACG